VEPWEREMRNSFEEDEPVIDIPKKKDIHSLSVVNFKPELRYEEYKNTGLKAIIPKSRRLMSQIHVS